MTDTIDESSTPQPPANRVDGKAEYIITLKNYSDLESFYDEMEKAGNVDNSMIPERAVECVNKRPSSRNTHYMLTRLEEHNLSQDPRVESITLHTKYTGIKAGTCSTKIQQVNADRSDSVSSNMINWGLLRCQNELQTSGWGIGGTTALSGTLSFAQTGKNVDIVICDAGGVYGNHPEYAANIDGSGGTRVNLIDWMDYDTTVKGKAKEYSYFDSSLFGWDYDPHSGHVTGTAAGNRQGWARDANIYNIAYSAGLESLDNHLADYCFDYIRAWHNSKTINSETGRKNPTIVNNSWGFSLNPGNGTYFSGWNDSSITAITYRGTRYEAQSGTPGWNGIYAVCNESINYADLPNKKNGGNRITTSGGVEPSATSGRILTSPWSINSPTAAGQGWHTEWSNGNAVGNQYVFTIQGPAEFTLQSSFFASCSTGTVSIAPATSIYKGSESIYLNQSGSQTGTNISGTVNIYNNGQYGQRYILPENTTYTVYYESYFSSQNATDISTSIIFYVNSYEHFGGSVTSTAISSSVIGPASLTSSTTPTSGNNDNGYWSLTLPFNINYMAKAYNNIFISTNGYISFGQGSSFNFYNEISSDIIPIPNIRKIIICGQDMSTQRIYYGVEGSSPNRTYRIRVESTLGYSGILGSPTVVYEVVFYENATNQIDIQIGENRDFYYTGYWTYEQLKSYGFSSYDGGLVRIPMRIPSLDADVKDAIADGIITIGAAGNGGFYHALPGDQDWNNTVELGIVEPESLYKPYYYHRGSSPTANDTDITNICVGAISILANEVKTEFSDNGPGVDIFAPGNYIMSPLPVDNNPIGYDVPVVDDPRSGLYTIGKISGTSMASPQVTGVLACALEVYPDMKQADAKHYITKIAKSMQLNDPTQTSGFNNTRSLNGAPNLYLYYKRERLTIGSVLPKQDYQVRPTTGAVYPRTRTRKRR